jgi:hypothetical protein
MGLKRPSLADLAREAMLAGEIASPGSRSSASKPSRS